MVRKIHGEIGDSPYYISTLPSGQNSRKSSLTIWHCILSAELTNTHSFRLLFRRFCPQGYAL